MRFFRPHPRVALARPADVTELAVLYRRAWESVADHLDRRLVQDQTASRDEIQVWLEGGFEIYVAREADVVVGAIRCSFPTSSCLLDRLAVAPEARRQGVGMALVEHVLNRARRAGMTKAWLTVPVQLVAARELGFALGFQEVARRPEDGIEVSLLEMPL